MDIFSLNKKLFTAVKLMIYDYHLNKAKRRALRYTRLTGKRAAVILTQHKWFFRTRLLPVAVRIDAIPSYIRGKAVQKSLYLTHPTSQALSCTSRKLTIALP